MDNNNNNPVGKIAKKTVQRSALIQCDVVKNTLLHRLLFRWFCPLGIYSLPL